MQSIVERRRGGETGIKAVEALRGERFWKGLEAGSWEKGGLDRRLLNAALYRSNTINPVRPDYGVVFPTIDDMRRLAPDSYAYRFEYVDGMKAFSTRNLERQVAFVVHGQVFSAPIVYGVLDRMLMITRWDPGLTAQEQAEILDIFE